MTRDQLLQLVKDVALELIARERPNAPAEATSWRERLDESLTLDAPLAELGWDSARMTWLLVRLEERLGVDTSTLSLYELHSVGDLLDQLLARMPARAEHEPR